METNVNAGPEECPPANTDKFTFKTFVHVIRDGNGQGGQDMETINKHLNFLYRDFSVFGIFFSLEGIDYVDDNTFNQFPVCTSYSSCSTAQEAVADNLFNSTYSNDDRIDIYFLSDEARAVDPDGNPTVSVDVAGKANGIPGSAFYFIDKNFNHVISHEMGHVLSLFHTFHGELFETGAGTCPDFGYETSDCNCGDYVEDTPADYSTHHPLIIPGLAGCLDNCEYVPNSPNSAGTCPTTYPVNGGYPVLTPPLSNIMSYHIDCSNTFTIGQRDRIKDHALDEDIMINYTDDDIHIKIDFTYDEAEGLSNQTGCYPNIIIEDGGILRVKKTLKMADQSRIIVRKGGKLFVDGGTITTCGIAFDEKWAGIIIEGDTNLPQLPFSNQGYVSLQNGGTIKRAEQAITIEGGGFIYGKNGIFENNAGGISFESYDKTNFSRIEDCSFIVNDEMESILDFTQHVKLESVNNVYFVNTDFINEQTGASNIESLGRGIIAHDARFGVGNNCVFEGLYVGVEAGAFSAPQYFSVRKSNFNNNVIGILSIGVNNFNIQENNFTIGGFSGAPLPTQDFHVGVEIMQGTGFKVMENVFAGSSNSAKNIGILVENLGIERNVIQLNDFSLLNKGNQAQGNNAGLFSGLEYLCNTNASNDIDFIVTVESDIAPIQGSGLATTNTFSHATIEANSDFRNLGPDITYFHRDTPTETPELENYVGLILLENPEVASCALPDGGGGGVIVIGGNTKPSFYSSKSTYQGLLNSNSDLSSAQRLEAAQKGAESFNLAGLIIRDILTNENSYNIDSLKVWLSNKETLEAALERASLSIDVNGEIPFNQSIFYTDVQAIQNQITLNQGQINNLDDYVKMIEQLLKQTERSIYQLGNSGLDVLKNYANSGGVKSAATSKALMNFAYQSHFRIIPQNVVSAQQAISNPNLNPNSIAALQQLNVFPNPARDKVIFAYDLLEDFETTQISIYNLHGKLVEQFEVRDIQGKITWDVADLSDGCYYYQLTCGKASEPIQKLVIIK